MSIVVSKNGKDAQKLDKAHFADEDYMQEYIHNNPESIPIYELQKDKKLFVMKREFPTNAGPIDALAVDEDGDIYIVETKLYKNPDKRTVVAQALDYGAALWKHLNDFTVFIDTLDTEIQKQFSMTFAEKLIDFYAMEESDDVDILLEAMRVNLNEGNIKFVILMDSIDERLKDLILYVNQNSQFDIYAVQLEYYKYEEYEIMIPKIFGLEVKKNITSGGKRGRKCTKEEFLQDSREKTDKATYKVLNDLLEFSNVNADRIVFGTGEERCFSYKLKTPNGEITPLLVYSDGEIYSNLGFILYQEKVDSKIVETLIAQFEKIESGTKVKSVQEGQSLIKFLFDEPSDKEASIIKKGILEFTKKVKI